MKDYKLYIGGKWLDSKEKHAVVFPFNGEEIARSSMLTAPQMEEAIKNADEAFKKFRRVSRYTRSRLLHGFVAEITRRREEFVTSLIMEAGKPRPSAEVEVNRALMTFGLAADEAKRYGGEVVPLDIDAGGRAYHAAKSFFTARGPVLAITPFNFPLNLVAHKIAPAFAVGAPVILKPPPQAPGCSIMLAEIFEKWVRENNDPKDEIPAAAFQVIIGENKIVEPAIQDARLPILSFTGSDKVGWWMQTQAPRKKVLLELGGNAAVIIHSDADLNRAALRCAAGGFGYAGQTCISVQRIYVHQSIHDKFVDLLKSETAKLKCGDPRQADVTVGPVIDKTAADRIMNWIDEAVKDGAQITGGKRDGQMITPAILTGVKKKNKISCEEVFGPVVVVEKYSDIQEAVDLVNDSRFGLQAGIFTDSARLIHKACEELDVGGVIVNEIPTFRADHLPYGGIKDSGLGREGLRYAMEDYSERKTVVEFKDLRK